MLEQLRQRQQQLLLSCPLILFLLSGSPSQLVKEDDPAVRLYQDVLRQYTETMRGYVCCCFKKRSVFWSLCS